MIRNTLFGKLLLVFLLFGALMMAAFVYVMAVSHETFHAEFEQTTNRELAKKYVDANLLIREPPLDAHNFASALRHIIEINPGNDLYILDAKGQVLASSLEAGRISQERIDLIPIRQFLARERKFPLWGPDPAQKGRQEIFSAAHLAIAGCPAAYLYVVLHREEHASQAGGLKTLYAIREGLGVLVIAVVLALVASLLLLRMLTRRLDSLREEMERVRGTELSESSTLETAESQRGDEVERLRHLFLQLVDKIRGQMKELQRTDEFRRELLTNVSHDLRTPLATLSVHLESLLMKAETQDYRGDLTTAYSQCRRLGKLIEQLLEIAKLDTGQEVFTPEPFALSELVQDVVHKFELSARRAQVSVCIEGSPALPLVFGDVRLIEKVLDNLLDNAFRHGPPGGEVRLTLTPQPATVRVEVHDSGPGIPASERHRIFDRFYRGDKNRPTDAGYFGLGLAIARGILALHGQRIDFESEPDQGTTFFFELSIATKPATSNSGVAAIARSAASA